MPPEIKKLLGRLSKACNIASNRLRSGLSLMPSMRVCMMAIGVLSLRATSIRKHWRF